MFGSMCIVFLHSEHDHFTFAVTPRDERPTSYSYPPSLAPSLPPSLFPLSTVTKEEAGLIFENFKFMKTTKTWKAFEATGDADDEEAVRYLTRSFSIIHACLPSLLPSLPQSCSIPLALAIADMDSNALQAMARTIKKVGELIFPPSSLPPSLPPALPPYGPPSRPPPP